MAGVRNFQNTCDTHKRSFNRAFSIYMTVPLIRRRKMRDSF